MRIIRKLKNLFSRKLKKEREFSNLTEAREFCEKLSSDGTRYEVNFFHDKVIVHY